MLGEREGDGVIKAAREDRLGTKTTNRLSVFARLSLGALLVLGVVVLPPVIGAGNFASAEAREESTPHMDLHLQPGERVELDLGALARIAVADPEVVDIKADSGRVIFVGGRPGITSVMIWNRDGSRQAWRVIVEDLR